MDHKQMLQDILPIYWVNAQVEFIDDTWMIGMYLDWVIAEDEIYLVDVLQFIRDVEVRKSIFGEELIKSRNLNACWCEPAFVRWPAWKEHSRAMATMEKRQEQLQYLYSFYKRSTRWK